VSLPNVTSTTAPFIDDRGGRAPGSKVGGQLTAVLHPDVAGEGPVTNTQLLGEWKTTAIVHCDKIDIVTNGEGQLGKAGQLPATHRSPVCEESRNHGFALKLRQRDPTVARQSGQVPRLCVGRSDRLVAFREGEEEHAGK